MPKIKTRKAAKKRFRINKKGKVKRASACKRHLLTGKTRKRKRGLRKRTFVSKSESAIIKKLLPYG